MVDGDARVDVTLQYRNNDAPQLKPDFKAEAKYAWMLISNKVEKILKIMNNKVQGS